MSSTIVAHGCVTAKSVIAYSPVPYMRTSSRCCLVAVLPVLRFTLMVLDGIFGS